MKGLRTVAVAVFLIGTAAAVWLFWPDEREPVCRGKSLSDWLVLDWDGPEQQAERARAIQAIGSNAVPFLVRWVGYEMEPWRKTAICAVPKLGFLYRQEELAFASAKGFEFLGSEGRSAIPELTRMLKGTNVVVAQRALVAIDYMGIEGIPALLDFVANRQAYSCSSVLRPVGAMRKLGTNSLLVVPALTQCLKSPDSEAAGIAAILLANIWEQTQAEVIVATLAGATESGDPHVRYCAVYALSRLGYSAWSAVPALVRALGDSDVRVRETATNSLRKVEPQILGLPRKE